MTFTGKFIIGFSGAKDFTLKTIMISNIGDFCGNCPFSQFHDIYLFL